MRKTAPTSPDWLDEQYDNRARVPEHPAILDRWAAESECVRRERRCLLDRRYGDCPSESLDIFLPETDVELAPVIVFIHGGWWRALDKADHSFVAPAFTEAGVLVVVPNYALCPAVSIDHIAVQMAQAVAWTWRCAPQYGGDRRRIVLVGHSAGGHLAAMLLTCLWRRLAADLPSSLMRGALAISGVFDLDPLRRTPFLQKDLRLTPASARRLSPVRLPPPAAPLYAVAGGQESQEFLRHLRSIEDAWGQTCVPVSETIPGTNHFTVLDELARPGSRLHHLAMALAFE